MSQVKSFGTAFSRLWRTDWKPEDAGVMARRNAVVYCFLNTLLMGAVVWKGITLVGGLLAVAVACCQWGLMLVRSKNRISALSGVSLLAFTDLILLCLARYPFFLTGVDTQPRWAQGTDPLIWLWAIPSIVLLVWGIYSRKRRWPLLASGLLWCWTCVVGMGSAGGFEGLGPMGRSLLLLSMTAVVAWYGVSHAAFTVLPQQQAVGFWLWVPLMAALPVFLGLFPAQASWLALSLPRLLTALTPNWSWLLVALLVALLSVPMQMSPQSMGVDALGLWCLSGGIVLVWSLRYFYFSWCWLLVGAYAVLCYSVFKQEMKKQGTLGIHNQDMVLLLTLAAMATAALLSWGMWPLAVTAAVWLLAIWTRKKRGGRIWPLVAAMCMTLMLVLGWQVHRSGLTFLLIALTFVFVGAVLWLLGRPLPGGVQLPRWISPAAISGTLLLSLVLLTRAGVAISGQWEEGQLLVDLTPRAADSQVVRVEAQWETGEAVSLLPGENTVTPAGEKLTVTAVDGYGVESSRVFYTPYTLKTLAGSLETTQEDASLAWENWKSQVALDVLLLRQEGQTAPDIWGEDGVLHLAHPVMAGAADYQLAVESDPPLDSTLENGVFTVTTRDIVAQKAYESNLTLLDSQGGELDRFHFWLMVGVSGEQLALPIQPNSREPMRLVSSSGKRLAQDGGALYLGPAGSAWQLSAQDGGYALRDDGWSDLYLTTLDGALAMAEAPACWDFACCWVMGSGRFWQLSRDGLTLMTDGEALWLEEGPENGFCWQLTPVSEEG